MHYPTELKKNQLLDQRLLNQLSNQISKEIYQNKDKNEKEFQIK